MVVEPKRIPCGQGALRVVETATAVMGFSEPGASLPVLRRWLDGIPLAGLTQVHGNRVVLAGSVRSRVRADGWLMERPGLAGLIVTADCLPLFYWHPRLPFGGVLHVGWRGLLSGIERQAIDALARCGIVPDELNFWIGPGVEKRCYEVGDDLARAFASRAEITPAFTPRPAGKFLFDLKRGLRLSLEAAGARPERIADAGICTRCHPLGFPSVRRDGPTGRRIFSFFHLR